MAIDSSSVARSETLPSWYAAAHTRNLASLALHQLYRLRAHGAFHVGTDGPLLLVVPSEAVLAGVVVQAVAPRPVHVVVSTAAMTALPPVLRRVTGAIGVDAPTAVAAQHAARAALEDGRVVAVCGATVSAGYLVATTGVPVVPVTLLGVDGRVVSDPPRPGAQIDAYFVPPVRIDVPGEPLRVSTRAVVDENVRQVVADATEQAQRRAGWTTEGWQ